MTIIVLLADELLALPLDVVLDSESEEKRILNDVLDVFEVDDTCTVLEFEFCEYSEEYDAKEGLLKV